MKSINHNTFLLILITLSLALTVSPLAAQVYKVVDEDGNVTFTDQPPADGTKPIKLRPISVVEAPVYETVPKASKESAEDEDGDTMSLGYLRKNYKDFAIVAPKPEESVWNPQQSVTVAWNVRYQLQQGMQVSVFVDGQLQATTTEQIIPIDGLERGEHTVTAELKDAKNRRVATALPVTFFIKRPIIFSNRPNQNSQGG